MVFNPLQFLKFSKKLCSDEVLNDLETITRVVIGRVYYSAFLHAKEYLKENHSTEFSNDRFDHRMVQELIMTHVDRAVGSLIRELCTKRDAADYNLNNPATLRTRSGASSVQTFDIDAQTECIQIAEEIVSRLPRE
ncbi:MAG: hypothetical protein NUK62_08700 [Tenericutes bacterium]|nr:hypothetical protein [Mycoplasmatota bacterium]